MAQERASTEAKDEGGTLLPRADEAGTLQVTPDQAPKGGNGEADAGGPLPAETDRNLHLDPTMVQPAGAPPTVQPHEMATQAAAVGPTDVTLDPNDPRVRAFHEESQRPAKGPGPSIATGAAFGDYHLIEPIAKGGMGIVYKAKQRKLNRIVAIKMILAGQFADQSDIDRFYVEAEAAAALTHPNIVAIHEVGEFEGQHFFSMDYIEGESLSHLVRESPLPPRRAAEMVRIIAETMQFAHDRGIVHRDLKPSNILLDKKQRPLITDFGLAKQVSNQSQLTISGAIVGTPSYMPPEQAAGKGDEVGPWSDLYSLGAILYEVLTGRPPFRAATPFETIRQVLDTEPLSPRLVNPNVPRDLETVCLKCLQKNREGRYASAQELADELDRFLRGEPIHARPISKVARFWRLCKRYPVTSSAIAAAILMLIAAAGVSSVAYVKTSAALAQSEQSRKDAMAAVEEYFTKVSEESLLNEPGMQPLRKDLLELALRYYDKFLTQRAGDPTVEDELAKSLFRIGVITEVLQTPEDALPSYKKARAMQERLLAMRPDDRDRLKALGDTLNAMGTYSTNTKDYEAARRDYGEAVRIRARLVAADSANSEYQRALANVHMNIGVAERNAGRLEEARKQFEEAQKIRQAALALDLSNAKLRRDLGKGFFNLGRLDIMEGGNQAGNTQAEEHFKRAAAVFEKLAASPQPDLDDQKRLAICYRLLGDLLTDDRATERRRYYQQALKVVEPLAAQNPAVAEYQADRAGLWLNLSGLESQLGDTQAARKSLEQARDILTALVKRSPDPWYQRDLAVTLRELAIVQDAAGQTKEAAETLAEAMGILNELVDRHPDEPAYAEQLQATKQVTLASETPPAIP